LIASGWYTAAMTMRLVTESEFRSAAPTIGLGFDELRWPIPVRPGDELRIESEVLDVRLSKSRQNQGLLKTRILTFNQQGQVVQRVVANELVPRDRRSKDAKKKSAMPCS
jgi:acyl dehydratase